MTPYVNMLYFAVLLYPLVPALGLGLFGQMRLWYVLVATIGMLLVQYRNPFATGTPAATAAPLHYLAAYALYETVIVMAFALVRRRWRVQAVYVAAVVLVLLPLVAVKVFPLLLAHHWLHAAAIQARLGRSAGGAAPSAVNTLAGSPVDTFGFIGISYVTFRYLDAVISVQDAIVGTPGLGTLLTYALFFPCISSGPIDRFRRFADDVRRKRRPGEYALDVDAGLYRIAQGFLYKFLIAREIYIRALQPLTSQHDLFHTWLYMYVYSFYLFFDFAGYTAFAIGVSRFFGVQTPENFRAPFWSHNFKEFWNRWFITLSWYLRDHVYMRFVLGATRRRWFKNRYVASYIGYMLVFLTMGFWHGLQANYIVYGCYHGVMISANDFLSRWNTRRRLIPDNAFTRLLAVFATFNLVCFGMLIFSGHLFR